MWSTNNLKAGICLCCLNVIPSEIAFCGSFVSDVKSRTYVSKNFRASNLFPTDPGYNMTYKGNRVKSTQHWPKAFLISEISKAIN